MDKDNDKYKDTEKVPETPNSLIPNMKIDTSPWSSCSRLSPWSPWLPCSSHTYSSTGPSVSPFRDFLVTFWFRTLDPPETDHIKRLFSLCDTFISKSGLVLSIANCEHATVQTSALTCITIRSAAFFVSRTGKLLETSAVEESWSS